MFAAFVILFREILEISLILGVIAAATRGVAGRGRWIGIGIAGGVAGSCVVAWFADGISQAMEGTGQELFNAGILFVAVAMIGWTVIWMQKHGRELSQRIKRVGAAVSNGELPLYALATIVCLTMWREGSEVALFMTGILSTSEESLAAILTGAALGVAVAGTIGTLLYLGLITLSTRHLFAATSWLLILLACGMSAQAAGFLTSAGTLPELVPQVWDSSHLLSQSSVFGQMLHAMIGYTERPSAMQLVFYAGTFAVIFGLLKWTTRARQPGKPTAAATAA